MVLVTIILYEISTSDAMNSKKTPLTASNIAQAEEKMLYLTMIDESFH